ncbi:MAG: hypothetical protein EB084_25885 [Proteobacteria bacterium]|nr:hypothetical protein [Pseudomonadota bacterium]
MQYAFVAFALTTAVLVGLYGLHWQPWRLRAREPRFLDAHQTRAIIQADSDGYAAALTSADLHARQTASIAAYVAASAGAADDFTPEERARIRECVAEIDAMPGLAALAPIPWVFAKTRDRVYENGLPHTRGSVIFLCPDTTPEDDDALTNLLVHEKVHVFQRLAPDYTDAYIRARGYERTRTRRADYSELVRSNPDLDEWVYTDADEGPIAALYTSATPASITDVDMTGHEHPFEAMAYEVGRTHRL